MIAEDTTSASSFSSFSEYYTRLDESIVIEKSLPHRKPRELKLKRKEFVGCVKVEPVEVNRIEDGDFVKLPIELWFFLLTFLDITDLVSVFCLNSNFSKLANNENFFQVLYKAWGGTIF
jgi:hypothetical protein